MKFEVTEVCPHCEREVTVTWNPEEDGYQIFCPQCGERIMLCSACMDASDNTRHKCDWDDVKGCFRKPVQLPLEEILQRFIDKCYSTGLRDANSILDTVKRNFPSYLVSRTNHDLLLEMGMSYETVCTYIPLKTISVLIEKDEEKCTVYIDKNNVVKIKKEV